MKKSIYRFTTVAVAFVVGALFFAACKSSSTSPTPTPTSPFAITYLVSDTAGYAGAKIDPNLANAWGIAVGPTGKFWLASNHGSSTTIYDSTGTTGLAAVFIPSRDSVAGGSPSGLVYNATTDFAIPAGGASKFIFSSEDGIISAWGASSGASAVKVATSLSDTGVYKGLAIASDGGSNFLYATNFRQKKIDVYDKNFTLVTTKPFVDPNIPPGYGPFGIANIGGMLYVTYAKIKGPDDQDDESGAGNGYVDVYTPNGTLMTPTFFASNGTLNSPWGIAKAPANFGDFKNAILIGNFGDGKINAYDSTGKFLGQLEDNSGTAISISGLWGLMFVDHSVWATGDGSKLYFTAGPSGETYGLFGYIKLQ